MPHFTNEETKGKGTYSRLQDKHFTCGIKVDIY